MTLHIASFGGGVVLEGAADQRRISEVLRADSLSIGTRGALVAASDASDYVVINDRATVTPVPWTALHALGTFAAPAYLRALAAGEGSYPTFPAPPPDDMAAYLLAVFLREGASSPIGGSFDVQPFGPPWNAGGAIVFPPVLPEGVVVTVAPFPGMFNLTGPAAAVAIVLINIGAREGTNAIDAPGLYALTGAPPTVSPIVYAIDRFDALGTGERGVVPGGTDSKQLRFRGIVVYNNHAFGWGYDSADVLYNEGPGRAMFCNLGDPLTWGNDPGGAGNRAFTDSDAIEVGGSGELIRAGCVAFGRLFLGTNQGLHFITGYGRDSFLTDGFQPIMRAENVVGPHAMIEGPDKMLYGVGDNGLWKFLGDGVPAPLYLKLVDFEGNSNGYWDLIWTDRQRSTAYPGRTNQDLVWTAVDWDAAEVLIGIPWCDATAGEGYGLDTVVIRYNVRTDGFTRQVFEGVQYTAASFARREGQFPAVKFLGTPTADVATVRRYGYAANGDPPMMPSILPRAELGWYAPFGPDGDGVTRRVYLTLAWEGAAALPLAFDVSVEIDESEVDSFALYVSPTISTLVPAGTYWVDTSETDTNIGNATATSTVRARGGYLLKVKQADGSWIQRGGMGQKGSRVTVPLGIERVSGARMAVIVQCTEAGGRFQIEGLGLEPGGGSAAA